MNRPFARLTTGRSFPNFAAGALVRAPRLRVAPRVEPEDLADVVRGAETWKRCADVVLSLSALAVAAPLIVIIAALVKLTSRGPVFVAQERTGIDRRCNGDGSHNGAQMVWAPQFSGERRRTIRHGKPFKMYKFRSMWENAENGTPQLATQKDPRITPVGRVLRKARLDEIPQFVNVLRGEMSIVGPRPEREYFYQELEDQIPGFSMRLRTKPGITGLAQVNLGYANTVVGMRRKLTNDLQYISDLRPSTDAKILLRTVLVVLTGKGAY